MDRLAELQARIQALEDIQAIKNLKARYWRCLDSKLWDELETLFHENAVGEGLYGTFEGGKAIAQFNRDQLGADSVETAHGGHNPEIEITSDTTARAVWPLQDYVSFGPNRKLIGYGHYHDEYVKVEGEWKIMKTKLVRILEEWTIAKREKNRVET